MRISGALVTSSHSVSHRDSTGNTRGLLIKRNVGNHPVIARYYYIGFRGSLWYVRFWFLRHRAVRHRKSIFRFSTIFALGGYDSRPRVHSYRLYLYGDDLDNDISVVCVLQTRIQREVVSRQSNKITESHPE